MIYLDTSAAAKLSIHERETDALETWLDASGGAPVSNLITVIELRRAAARRPAEVQRDVRETLAQLGLLPLTVGVARGYALRQMGNYSTSCNCHIYDDTRDQNFTGWNKESEGANAHYGKRWVAAVNGTNTTDGRQGKVLTHDGQIAATYYFSSSGGRTENSEDIWTATVPYLRGVDDPASLTEGFPDRAWTRTITQAQAKAIFGLSDVASIKVTERTSGSARSAASEVTATSSTGVTRTISGPESVRIRIVGGKSPWIWSFSANY